MKQMFSMKLELDTDTAISRRHFFAYMSTKWHSVMFVPNSNSSFVI